MAVTQPSYSYYEINVMSLSGLAPHIKINEQVRASLLRLIEQVRSWLNGNVTRASYSSSLTLP